MDFDYMVHGVSLVKGPVKVMHDGEEIIADVDTLEVELSPPHDNPHGGGSLVLRFKGSSIATARAMFVADKMVTLTCNSKDEWVAGKGPHVKKGPEILGEPPGPEHFVEPPEKLKRVAAEKAEAAKAAKAAAEAAEAAAQDAAAAAQ